MARCYHYPDPLRIATARVTSAHNACQRISEYSNGPRAALGVETAEGRATLGYPHEQRPWRSIRLMAGWGWSPSQGTAPSRGGPGHILKHLDVGARVARHSRLDQLGAGADL